MLHLNISENTPPKKTKLLQNSPSPLKTGEPRVTSDFSEGYFEDSRQTSSLLRARASAILGASLNTSTVRELPRSGRHLAESASCPKPVRIHGFSMLRWAEHLKGSPKQPYFHAAVLAGRNLYSFGGWHDDVAASGDQMAVHVLDTVSLRWAKMPPTTTRTTALAGGGEWHRPLDDVPSMRYGHTATLISDDLVYVWGGYPYCDVLYLYAGGGRGRPRWSKPCVSGTAPAAREGHSACTLGGAMYVHGGWNQMTGYTDDLHKMDAGAGGRGEHLWSAVRARGVPPPASYCHSATAVGTRMFVFGGVGDDRRSGYGDGAVGVFDVETGCWLSPAAPQPSSSTSSARPRRRWCHAAFARGGALYVFGGCDATRSFGDLWRFDPETLAWRRVVPRGSGPGPMCRMCCCVLPGGDRVLLFGGVVGLSSPTDELHVLDFAPSLRTLCLLAVVRLYVVSYREKTACAAGVVGRSARRPDMAPP